MRTAILGGGWAVHGPDRGIGRRLSSMRMSILLDQPDLIEPGRTRRFRFGPQRGERISILNARGNRFEGGGDEPDLSLKWVPEGAASYRSGRTRHCVAGSAQLLLNRGQPYRLSMHETSESFVLFFPPLLSRAAWQAQSGRMEEFPEVPALAAHSHAALQELLVCLRAEAKRAAPSFQTLEELAFGALAEVAALAATRRGQAARVPAMRAATRAELLRRLAKAESYLIENSNHATLDGASSAAALSRFHLIRLFRAVHGKTPLAYAAGRRLEAARDALIMTRDAIEEIARRAGYDSRTAFDRAFSRRFGATPGTVRAAGV